MTEQPAQKDTKNESMTDPSKFRSPPPGFKCGEELEKGDGSIGRSGVSFYCILTQNQESNDNRDIRRTNHRRLTFSCRDRSVGVLESQELAITKDEYDATENFTAGDPFFFDAGYTLAGRTGFQVWSVSDRILEERWHLIFSMVLKCLTNSTIVSHEEYAGNKINDRIPPVSFAR